MVQSLAGSPQPRQESSKPQRVVAPIEPKPQNVWKNPKKTDPLKWRKMDQSGKGLHLPKNPRGIQGTLKTNATHAKTLGVLAIILGCHVSMLKSGGPRI